MYIYTAVCAPAPSGRRRTSARASMPCDRSSANERQGTTSNQHSAALQRKAAKGSTAVARSHMQSLLPGVGRVGGEVGSSGDQGRSRRPSRRPSRRRSRRRWLSRVLTCPTAPRPGSGSTAGTAPAWPSARLSFCWHPLSITIERHLKGEGGAAE